MSNWPLNRNDYRKGPIWVKTTRSASSHAYRLVNALDMNSLNYLKNGPIAIFGRGDARTPDAGAGDRDAPSPPGRGSAGISPKKIRIANETSWSEGPHRCLTARARSPAWNN